MKGLDLSRMKKISSDSKTTVFRHDMGHEVKIAHAGLSPKMMEQLQNIPMQGQKMANGGEPAPAYQNPGDPGQFDNVDQYVSAAQAINPGLSVGNAQAEYFSRSAPSSPMQKGELPGDYQERVSKENQNRASSVDQAVQGSDSQSPTQDPVQPQQIESHQRQTLSPDSGQTDPDSIQGPSTASVSPADNQSSVMGPNDGPQPQPASTAAPVDMSKVGPPAPAQTYQNNMENLSTQDAHFAQSLNSGEIKPETYSDLFAHKSTLGKIGMIFGLMVGSAGAGLSHQQNALLAAMNQEINNDLDAQKQSKANAQNFLRLSQQHQQMMAENTLKGQQAGLIGAQTNVAKGEAAINAQALAQSRMQYSVLHSLYQKANMLPAGPQKAAATQALGAVSQAVDQDVANRNHQASTAISQKQAMQSNPDEDDFNNQVKAFTLTGNPGMAEYMQSHHVPGMPGQTEIAVPQDVRGQLNAQAILDNKGKDLLSYVNQHTGTWNPQTRAIASQKIEEMKNFYNDSIKGGALTQGRLGWYDEQFAKNPTDILPQVMGSTAKLQEMVKSNESRMNQTLKSYGGHPSDPTSGTPNQASDGMGSSEIERLDKKSGKIVVYDAATKKPLRWK